MKTLKKIGNYCFYIMYVLILILFFEPGVFKEKYLFVDTFFDYAKLALSIIVFIKYILYKVQNKNYSRSIVVFLVCIYQIICLLITIFNNGDLIRFTGPAITSVVVLMTIEMLAFNKDLFKGLKCLNIYFRICFIINVITIILSFLVPEERFVYFLGIDNRFIFMYLPWMLIEILTDIHDNGKITKRSIIAFFLMELTLIAVNTVAAMVAFLIWIVPLFFKKIDLMKKVNLIVNLVFLFDIFVVRFRLSYALNSFLNLIGKYPHISGRVLIWDVIFNTTAKDHFLLGIGMQSEKTDMAFFGNTVSNVYAVSHAHNTFVDIIYRFGFVGFILFSAILYVTISNIIKNNRSKYAMAIFVSLVIVLVLGIFDTLLFAGFYLIVALACNLDIIDYVYDKIRKKNVE